MAPHNRTLMEGQDQNGFTVLPTRVRKEAQGQYLIKLRPDSMSALNLGRYAVAAKDGKAGFGRVVPDEELGPRECRVDQTIRVRIGIQSGDTVEIFPIRIGWQAKLPFIHPRVMILELHIPEDRDAEMNLCRIHPDNMKLMALSEGDYLRIQAVIREGREDWFPYRVTAISRGAFSKSSYQPSTGVQVPPMQENILLDFDARLDLRLTVRSGVPILVQADVVRLFAGRLVYYGLSLLLGFTGLSSILDNLAPAGASKAWVSVVSVLVSLVANMFLILLDLRARVEY